MLAVNTQSSPAWSIWTSLGSVAAAFAASVCCVGPLLLTLLGVGGAGMLIKLEPYRPLFTVVTIFLLGAAFYFTYRRSRGAACACPRSGRNKLLLWIATVLVAGFLSFPYFTEYLFG